MKYAELIITVFALMLFPSHRMNLQAQQFLPVGNIVNARDLGGYPTADGKTVRSGLLLRSASLADASEYGSMTKYLQGPLRLSEEDIRLLKEHYLQAGE